MCHLLLKRVVWILFVSLLISLWTLIHSFVYVQLENVLWTCVSPFANFFFCCLKRNSSIGYPLTSWVGPYVKPFFFLSLYWLHGNGKSCPVTSYKFNSYSLAFLSVFFCLFVLLLLWILYTCTVRVCMYVCLLFLFISPSISPSIFF